MPTSVAQALAKFEGKRALLIGDPLLDVFLYGETVRVSREAPVLVVRKERTEHRLGGAANTAANLAALGVRVNLLAVVGNDASAQSIADLLAAQGVDVTGMLRVSGVTPVKTRVLAGAFGTGRQQVLRIDDEPNAPVGQAAVEKLLASAKSRAAESDVVVVSDYGLGLATPVLVDFLGDVVRKGTPVVVDSRYDLRMFKGVTAVTPNLPEGEAFVGYALTSPEALARAGVQVSEQLQAACLLTQGRGGMTLFAKNASPVHVDIVGDEEVVDVTGAGDTVIATFGAGLGAGLPMDVAMRLANIAAGVVVTKLGTATASPAEIAASAQRFGITI